MNGRLANARAITKQLLFDNCQPESASDVISGADVEQVGMNVLIKFGDFRSNRSRDIRLPHFVTNDTGAHHSSHKGKTPPIGVLPNKMPTNWWGRQNAAPLKFDPKPSEAAFSAVFRTSVNADRK